MKDMIERALSTRDKDENIMGMVTFPCNKEEVLQRFQVDDLKELYFVDRPDSRMSVARFNISSVKRMRVRRRSTA